MKAITFFWIVFSISIYLMYQVYHSYLMDMIIALFVCVATYGVYIQLSSYIKNSVFCALLSVLFLIVILVVPLFFLIKSIVSYAGAINPSDFHIFIESMKLKVLNLASGFPGVESKIKEILSNISANSILNSVLSFSSNLGKSSLSFIIDTGFILVFLFFYFLYGRVVYAYVISLIPFENAQIDSVIDEVASVIKVVFYTSLVNVLLQGFAFGVMIVFFGYDGVFFGMIYGVASLVPIVGGGLVWLPIALYEFYLDNTFAAIFIAIYALAICAVLIDNVIKPILIGIINKKVLKTSVHINELVIFFAILAGLTSFGFWGIFLGPAITALFISLLRIYKQKTSKQSLDIQS